MPRTEGRALYYVKDIWVAYATQLLAKNKGWWSTYNRKLKCRHYSIGHFNPDGSKHEVMNYTQFRKIVEFFFDRAKTAIIQGECINLHSRLGKICIKRVQRDFRNGKQRSVNWAKTAQQAKVWSEEKQKMVAERIVYFTTNEWCRIAWIKTRSLTNERVYEFAPAHGNSKRTAGFKAEFSQAEQADPLLKYRYLYQPFVIKKSTAI